MHATLGTQKVRCLVCLADLLWLCIPGGGVQFADSLWLCVFLQGLRAIKSVLVVAGSLLRAEAGQVESDVLFRALRDFNIPKILSQVGALL
jgi:hypothetical protein